MYVGDVYEDDVDLVIPSGGGGVLLNGKKQKAMMMMMFKARSKGVNLTLTPFLMMLIPVLMMM